MVAIALAEPGAAPQGAIAVVQITQQPLQVPPRSQVRLDPPSAAYAAISPYFGSSWVTVQVLPRGKVRRCTGKRLRGPWSDSAPSVTTSRSRIRFSNAGRLSADSLGYPQTRVSGQDHCGRRGLGRLAREGSPPALSLGPSEQDQGECQHHQQQDGQR